MQFKSNQLYNLCSLAGGEFAVRSDEEAFGFCKQLTTSHYENFPVASVLIPEKLRKYVFSIYSFARIADDISDEIINEPEEKRINALTELLSNVVDSTAHTTNPVIVSLRRTINDLNLPSEPFEKLITAFCMDVNFVQPDNLSELLNYCEHSANPIGELILRLFGELTDERLSLSDKICTGLQMINFWQDFSRDIPKGRIYIPKEIMHKHNINQENLLNKEKSIKLNNCLNEIYDITSQIFFVGEKLLDSVNNLRLKMELKATYWGGMAVFRKTIALGQDIIIKRPKLSITDYFGIAFRLIKK